MKTKDTVKIALGIGEVMELLDYHWKLYKELEKYSPDPKLAVRHKKRYHELDRILNETWPK